MVHPVTLAGNGRQDWSKSGNGAYELAEAHEQVIDKAGLPALCPNSAKNLTVEQPRNVAI